MVLAVASPIDAVGESDLFFLHMTQHLLLGDIVPMCLLAGLTGPLLQPLLARLPVKRAARPRDPVRRTPDLGAQPRRSGSCRRSSTRQSATPSIHIVFHLCLLTAGTIMWLPVFETLPAPEWFGTGAKLAYIVAVRMVGTVLANVLVWASAPVLRAVQERRLALRDRPARATSSSPAAIMLLYDSLLTLVAIAWLFLRMAQEGEVRQQLIERGLDERAVRRAVRYGRWRELEGEG